MKVDMLARKTEALENVTDKTQLELNGAEDAHIGIADPTGDSGR